ncbi:hypothetical protein QG37_04951 [Candidozyma auris]|nr:hypothetical protein QG37_04951 [[Candida] auris]
MKSIKKKKWFVMSIKKKFVKIVRITYKGRGQSGNEGVTLTELLTRDLRSAMRRVTPMGQ